MAIQDILSRPPQTNENRNRLGSFVDSLFTKIQLLVQRETFKVEVQNNYLLESELNQVVEQLKSVVSYLQSTPGGQKINIRTPDIVSMNKTIEELLIKIGAKELKVVIPDTQRVRGDVSVNNLPEPYPFGEITAGLKDIFSALKSLKLEAPAVNVASPTVTIPPFPSTVSLSEGKAILAALSEVKEQIKAIPTPGEVRIPSSISVNNFPPQKYPMPVTNININPLRGYANSRNVTVGTTPTALPSTPLAYRRSLIVYNNSSGTLYIGGSDVTITNGLIIPTNSYSPALDAGPKLIVYGVTATGSADVRVFEASNENIGG